jgi:hypothetical protein
MFSERDKTRSVLQTARAECSFSSAASKNGREFSRPLPVIPTFAIDLTARGKYVMCFADVRANREFACTSENDTPEEKEEDICRPCSTS